MALIGISQGGIHFPLNSSLILKNGKYLPQIKVGYATYTLDKPLDIPDNWRYVDYMIHSHMLDMFKWIPAANVSSFDDIYDHINTTLRHVLIYYFIDGIIVDYDCGNFIDALPINIDRTWKRRAETWEGRNVVTYSVHSMAKKSPRNAVKTCDYYDIDISELAALLV